jgi:hypothetical protein
MKVSNRRSGIKKCVEWKKGMGRIKERNGLDWKCGLVQYVWNRETCGMKERKEWNKTMIGSEEWVELKWRMRAVE